MLSSFDRLHHAGHRLRVQEVLVYTFVKITSSHLKTSKTVKTVLESGFHAVDFGFHVSGTCVPKSNIYQDSGFLEQSRGFQSREFRIPREKNYRVLEFGLPYMGRIIMHLPLP